MPDLFYVYMITILVNVSFDHEKPHFVEQSQSIDREIDVSRCTITTRNWKETKFVCDGS